MAAETAFRLSALIEQAGAGVRMALASGISVVAHDPATGGLRLAGNLTATAAGLAAQAAPGQLLVSAATQRRLAPYFATRPAGDAAFALVDRTEVRTRIDAARILGFSPLVGRATEVAALERALEEMLEGQGRAVSLLAEGGFGKSRLAHEFKAIALDHDAVVLHARCQSHGRTRAHGPFTDVLRELLNIHDGGDQEDDAEARAIAKLLEIHPGLEPLLPQMLHLLALPNSETRLSEGLAGLALRRRLGEAVVAALTLAAERHPLVIIFDDWHWADEASRDTVQHLVTACAFHRLLILVCVPPESAPQWPPLPHCVQIGLRPLSLADVTTLVRSLARAERLAPGLAALLHARTDGVPLFVEELTRALLESGEICLVEGELVSSTDMKALDLPGSIEAVVRARLDRLDAELLEMLRVLSVVGRNFDRATADHLFGDADAVGELLARAVAQGLIQQTRVVPTAAYRFRHQLTQQVAYASLLMKQRRALHARVGAWLEAAHAEQLGEQLEAIANHYLQADVREKAIAYLLRAGERAAENASHLAAVELLRGAVDLLEQQPASEARDIDLLDAHVALGNSLILVRGYAEPEVVKVFERARELGRQVAAGPLQFPSYWMLMRFSYNRAQLDEAGEISARMRELAAGTNDPALMEASLAAEGVIATLRGLPEVAVHSLSAAIDLWKPDTERALALKLRMSPAVQAHAFLGLALVRCGRVREAHARFARALEIGRAIAHPESEVLALVYQHAGLTLVEEMAAAAQVNETLLEMATRHALPHWQALAQMNRGTGLILTGATEEGFGLFRAAADAVDAMGVTMVRDRALIILALHASQQGRQDEALELIAEARAVMEGGLRHMEAEIDRIEMRFLWPDDPKAALALARRGIAAATATGAHLLALRVAADAAGLLLKAGQPGEARAVLQPIWAAIDPGEHAAAPLLLRVGKLMDRLDMPSQPQPVRV